MQIIEVRNVYYRRWEFHRAGWAEEFPWVAKNLGRLSYGMNDDENRFCLYWGIDFHDQWIEEPLIIAEGTLKEVQAALSKCRGVDEWDTYTMDDVLGWLEERASLEERIEQ